MLEPKIQNKLCEQIQPLFDVWEREANWTKEESIVMYNKLFNPEKPDDQTIQYILADELNMDFLYYHRRKINRIYKSARKKLNKILP